MDRHEFLRREVAEYKRKISVYQTMIAEWERELGSSVPSADPDGNNDGVSAAPSTQLSPGGDPSTLIRQFEFAGKSQPEAAKLFLERFGKPLTTDELLTGLEKGGVKLGGKDRLQKKANFSTILSRAEGIVRVGRGAWALGSKTARRRGRKEGEEENASPAANE